MAEEVFELKILAPAQNELEDIARLYLALVGSKSAQRITDKIYDALEQLTRFPFSGPPVRDMELRSLGYRYILADKYVAIYKLIGKTVFVYHIFDGRSDYPTLFKYELF